MNQNKKLYFPPLGVYTPILNQFLKNLDIDFLESIPITQKTIQLGVKHSQEMMCFPFKITLGNFIEALDAGAHDLVMYDTRGRCRFRHYWKLQEAVLKNLGYDFTMYPLKIKNICGFVRNYNPELSRLYIWKQIKKSWAKIKKIDEFRAIRLNKTIGIIGEIYTCIESAINFNIEKKILSYGVGFENTVTLSDFIREQLGMKNKEKAIYEKIAVKYLNGPIGGHALQNIYNTLWMIKNGIDGIVYLMPLSCMPETTVSPIILHICQLHDTPVLPVMIDENNSPLNFYTRLETFVELIKRK